MKKNFFKIFKAVIVLIAAGSMLTACGDDGLFGDGGSRYCRLTIGGNTGCQPLGGQLTASACRDGGGTVVSSCSKDGENYEYLGEIDSCIEYESEEVVEYSEYESKKEYASGEVEYKE